MTKYLFCIIVGIILFILWNNYDGFSVGIPWIVTWDETGVPEGRAVFDSEYDAHDFYIGHSDYPNIHFPVEEGEPPCPAPISESEAARVCSENKANCAAGSLSGPNLGCRNSPPQPVRPFGTGTRTEGGAQQLPTCNRFIMTKAISCLKKSPKIMKSLFDEYKELSTRLSLSGGAVEDIADIPGFESLTKTPRNQLERSEQGSALSIIFENLRENGCQLWNLDIVLDILDNSPFLVLDFSSGDYADELALTTNPSEITRRSKIVIHILLFLIMCGFNRDIIIKSFPRILLDFQTQGFSNTFNKYSSHMLGYTIIHSLFIEMVLNYEIYSMYSTREKISYWLDTQGDRFLTYRGDDGIYNFREIDELTYDDYMSIFGYLDDNLFDTPLTIISALTNPVFKNFFGLPD